MEGNNRWARGLPRYNGSMPPIGFDRHHSQDLATTFC